MSIFTFLTDIAVTASQLVAECDASRKTKTVLWRHKQKIIFNLRPALNLDKRPGKFTLFVSNPAN